MVLRRQLVEVLPRGGNERQAEDALADPEAEAVQELAYCGLLGGWEGGWDQWSVMQADRRRTALRRYRSLMKVSKRTRSQSRRPLATYLVAHHIDDVRSFDPPRSQSPGLGNPTRPATTRNSYLHVTTMPTKTRK